MKKTALVISLMAAALLLACAQATPTDLQGALVSAQATQTAQAAKVESLTDLIAELQAARPVGDPQVVQATVTALAAERDGAQMRAAHAEATVVALAAQLSGAQGEITRLESQLAKALNQPTPTLAPTEDQRAAQLFDDARELYQAEAWEAAAQKLAELRDLDAGYQAEAVGNMLFQANYYLGLSLVEKGEIPKAATRFDQALQARPDDPDALEQRRLAALYLAGVKAEGLDLAEAVRRFATLHSENKGYADVAERLYAARLAYGDALGGKGDWCEAYDQYAAAAELEESDEIEAKRKTAEDKCAAAARPGTYVGEFQGYEDIRSLTTNWAAVRGQVRNKAGQPMVGITVQLRAFDWSAQATTDGNGKYAFDFLTNELEFTVSLVDLPSLTAETETKFGFAALVDFAETP